MPEAARRLFVTISARARPLFEPLLRRFPWAGRFLDALYYLVVTGRPVAPGDVRADTGPSRSPIKEVFGPIGMNVSAYIQSETGTGESARSMLTTLDAAGIPHVLFNMTDHSALNNDRQFTQFEAQTPYAFNLLHLLPVTLPHLFAERGVDFLVNRYNIGFWNWELESFPVEWLQSLRHYDEVWVSASFTRDHLALVSPRPVFRVPLALPDPPPLPPGLDRARFGIPGDSFVFLFMFNWHSSMGRKNPLGLIDAFKRAFTPDDNVVLFIKSSNMSGEDMELMRGGAGPARILFMDDILPREEVYALYALCDSYVSLHRAEGFGLPLAHAMQAGKPVIATGYGGNLDFMRPGNSYLVNHTLIDIEETHWWYRAGAWWADPDLDHAAALMRLVYENQEAARSVGAVARDDVRAE
ncbi:MAG: glycosyltransferase, partial [Dehalococcoidia bacterium]|nr:glycosyltransferase [Dehalococcoidia bacterium]